MVFCSFHIARRLFKEVIVGILIVEHTHEDIDMYFSYLFRMMWRNNTYVLVDLIKSFMDLHSFTVIL